ncbi:hypothetical protein EJ02DRAFT_354953 [Clathrospora elynae]|uniref:F-box domain-containing protein n=1 Tax=Clathrospora elynae TaxID=706981 RepID=A0A6A5SCA7_9PLEO|nr:hypothetical protein EJ02DRAFT_354953 [Clathrospora elynae]
MALLADAPIYRLPEELLLQIAASLPDSGKPTHLKNLCLVSSRVRAAAQEALHTTVKLAVSCGCHPKVNPVLKLLRTLFDRPDLASKTKTLRLVTVRKDVAKLCEGHSFDLQLLRTRSLARLGDLGYTKSHLWHRTIQNSIESGFAGLLLALLPNLVHLDFWVKDHFRGPPSSECMSGLFGDMTAPDSIVQGWKNLRHLTTSDTHLLKSGIEFNSLTSLDLKTISIGTILRLNGPRCLQGTENLRELALTVSMQFADRLLIEKAEIQLADLFDALGCSRILSLKIMLINDGYHIGDDLTTQLDAGYFMDQLNSVQSSLETLAITLETTDDESELEWLLDMAIHPKRSLRHFAALKQLVIPQAFLLATGSLIWAHRGKSCRPKNLPPMLETLELLYPEEDVEDWVTGFISTKIDQKKLPLNFRELTLTCRDEVGTPASYFTTEVKQIWQSLSADFGIETYAFCQIKELKSNLAALYKEGSLKRHESETDKNGWSDEDSYDTEDGYDSEDSDEDDDMPDLIDAMD